MKAKELIPADLENTLAELAELDSEVQEAIHMRQVGIYTVSLVSCSRS